MRRSPEVFSTHAGTKYLRDPGVVLLAMTVMAEPDSNGLREFLLGMDPKFNAAYLDYDAACTKASGGGAELVQLAGQLCYLSFGENRTPLADNEKYIRRILSSGHGSVLEHTNYSLLFYGIDRACTHELVRHRAGMAYSQVSQRYVDGEHLRFVMPYEYQRDVELSASFEDAVEHASKVYVGRANDLRRTMPRLEGESATDWRKRIQSCARECLPNSTEAPIVVTGNGRSWRHVINMRCSKHADVRIRRPMFRALQVLKAVEPVLFEDFHNFELPDGTYAAESEFPKP